MKVPVVKEYGSWAVLIFSCAAGITTGLLTKPWQTGRGYSVELLLAVLGMTLLVNSKDPLTSMLRAKESRKEHLLWLVFFGVSGLLLLLPVLHDKITVFFPFLPLVFSYVVLLAIGKEHSLLTELNGFALLMVSAPVTYFVITGEVSMRLFIAVFIFFAAGVFKVKARIKKTSAYRGLMVFYCVFAVIIYFYSDISVFILAPLFENIISVAFMREERLKTTGNTELIKGVFFTGLITLFWQ
jgi:hypothetical protein